MLTPRGYAWFDVGFAPQGPVTDPHQAERSCQALIRFISEVTRAYKGLSQEKAKNGITVNKG